MMLLISCAREIISYLPVKSKYYSFLIYGTSTYLFNYLDTYFIVKDLIDLFINLFADIY